MSRFNLSPSQFGGFGEGNGRNENGGVRRNKGIEGFLAESPMTSPDSKSSRKIGMEQTVLPVTIKQIKTAPEPSGNFVFKIDGKEIKIVGQIEKVDNQTTYVEYTINDSTGSVPVKIWNDVDAVNQQANVTVQKLVAVTDYNLISYHIFETIYVHRLNTSEINAKHLSKDVEQIENAVNGAQNAIFEENDNLNYEQREILNYYKNDASESGPHISATYRAFPQENINHMVMEGLLYGTIDDDHLKAT